MQEVWKDIYFKVGETIYDYQDSYSVSNFGRIKNVKTNTIKSNRKDKDGYHTVSFWKNNKEKSFRVHRLVAFMFIDGYFEGAVVNHKDEDKCNNKVDNLEWCTLAYNNTYNNKHKRPCKKVSMYSLQGEYLGDFDSVNGAAKYFNKSVGNLVSHLKGRQKTYSGHIFKYREVGGDNE